MSTLKQPTSTSRRRRTGCLLVLILCLIAASAPFRNFASFPQQIRLFVGRPVSLHLALPVHASGTLDPQVAVVNGRTGRDFPVNLKDPLSIDPLRTGTAELKLRLFGMIPFKTVKLQVVPDLKVIPGGQTIGVRVRAAGIMVVGHHRVRTGPDTRVSPGEEARLKPGDLIVSFDGRPINDVHLVGDIVREAGEAGREIELLVQRNKERFATRIRPAYDEEDKTWRLGLYIRDSAAGVGTLTFYSPEHGVYGALGHVITDMDTHVPIEVGSGEIVQTNVTSIAKSQSGEPGEKRAHFLDEGRTLGSVERNTAFGIFGKMDRLPSHALHVKPVPVAFAEEVKKGPAELLTVVGGQKVERFDIEIVHVVRQTTPATKGLVIRVTDPDLLRRTGGIVQGMSGSPILQDGKLVGAVTHVFVNDPTSGYGCFIEWMLQDAGIMLKSEDAVSDAVSVAA